MRASGVSELEPQNSLQIHLSPSVGPSICSLFSELLLGNTARIWPSVSSRQAQT